MRHDKRHILWDRDDHPSPELLQQYQEETLPPALAHQLERHLLDCALCSDVLEGQLLSETSKIDAAEKNLNQRIAATFQSKKRKALPVYLSDWRVAAGIVLVLCSTVLVFYYNYKEVTQQAQGIASESDRAIEETMDLSEKPAAANPERLADAAPDTVRQTIAAAKPLPARQKSLVYVKPRVAPVEPDNEPIVAQEESEAAVVVADELAALPAPPPATVTEAAKSIASQNKQAFVPESTAVAKALQGRVAGVKMRRANAAGSVGVNQVRGQVISADGEPLPGVAVVIKGTTTGVATDAEGNFTLNLPGDKATLAFRFIGYETKEQTVDASTDNLIVDMQVDTRALSEVVVTGYGTSDSKPPVMVAPKPGIGSRAYRKYLEENIRYNSASKKGRVVVRATVSSTGALQNLHVVKSLCPSCDEEALRLVGQGPAWKPATSDGAKIEQEVKIVVRFNPEKKQ